MYSKKWTNQKSDPTIQTACQKEAYLENFINLGRPQAKWIHHLPTWAQGVDDIYNYKLLPNTEQICDQTMLAMMSTFQVFIVYIVDK